MPKNNYSQVMFKIDYSQIHNFPKLLDGVLWRDIPDTPHVQYWYAESEHYIIKFSGNKYAFVIARSPAEAYENYLKEIEEAK